MGNKGRILAGAVLAACLAAGGPALAGPGSGAVLTNFVSASYSLSSGAPGFETVRICKDVYNVPCVTSRWICVSNQPQLCMQAWKNTEPVTQTVAESGNLVCFEIGFCNCGANTGINVTVTDAVPANTVMADQALGPTSKVWVAGGFGTFANPMFSRNLAGPWWGDNGEVVAGQEGPLYMRWVFAKVNPKRTGYIRYCVNIQ